jgi:hypothetical protein
VSEVRSKRVCLRSCFVFSLADSFILLSSRLSFSVSLFAAVREVRLDLLLVPCSLYRARELATAR